MEDITVTAESSDPSPEDDSAHAAAVAEGATAVHADNAEQASDEAKAAAEAALASAAANIASAGTAEDAAERAEQAAEQAGVTLEMLYEALQAQGTAVSALTAELKASRNTDKPPAEPAPESKPADVAPQRRHWYYGG